MDKRCVMNNVVQFQQQPERATSVAAMESKEEMRVQILTGPTIRQRCVACERETFKEEVQAFALVKGFEYGDTVPCGAVCEVCLQDDATRRLPHLISVPTYQDLARARDEFNREDEVYCKTGVWPGLTKRRQRKGEILSRLWSEESRA